MLAVVTVLGCTKTPSIVQSRCPDIQKPCMAPFGLISVRPELFDGRAVRVYGYGRGTSTGVYLFENDKQILNPAHILSLRLVDKGSEMTFEREKLNNRWLDLTGVLRIERDGSRIYWLVLEMESFRERPVSSDELPPHLHRPKFQEADSEPEQRRTRIFHKLKSN